MLVTEAHIDILLRKDQQEFGKNDNAGLCYLYRSFRRNERRRQKTSVRRQKRRSDTSKLAARSPRSPLQSLDHEALATPARNSEGNL